MSQQGAALQNYNNELVKCIEDLCAKRDELQRQILIEEEDKHKIENEKSEKDSGPQRALVDMMNGTLETKRDLTVLEMELIPEPWMSQPIDTMTEDQKIEMDKFEKKKKLIRES